jgi:GNAT superfamily N-acetyltransferase
MEVRHAHAADAAAISDLAAQLGYAAAAAEVRERLTAATAAEAAAVLVAVDGGEVIGWVHVHGSVLLQEPPCAEIGGLVVDEGRRGETVGEDLLRAAETWAADRGYREVRARSNVVRERAHGFYRRLGYEVEKTSLTFIRRI